MNRSVFERMSTEREREAREHRAKGNELAEGIRADADRQRRVLLAEAYRESEEVRGDGDAQAASIYSRLMVRIRSSTRSTVACVPTVKASRTNPTFWSWTQAVTSSSTWKSQALMRR